jgi:inosine-uridine nucleoside N-ribohydrolase
MIDSVFEMHTSDPDDVFALYLLATHPQVNLLAVALYPGNPVQAGVIYSVLERLGRTDIILGGYALDSDVNSVSSFIYSLLDCPIGMRLKNKGSDAIADTLSSYPDATVITGAPPYNLFKAVAENPKLTINRWVAQGGFAGDNIVPKNNRLNKFDGHLTQPTYNFCRKPDEVMHLLKSKQIIQKDLVSKNVCHGIAYDEEMHLRMKHYKNQSPGLNFIFTGMEAYLQKHKKKIFHDPLAACVAIKREICKFKEIETYYILRKSGSWNNAEWGSEPAEGTGTFISISADKDAFFRTMIGQ